MNKAQLIILLGGLLWQNCLRADILASGTLANGNMVGLAFTNPPIVLTSPQSISVPAEQMASFSVLTSGALAYQWIANGVAIVGATNTTLSVANCDVPQRGNYQVVATNIYGSVTSSVAVLTITLCTNTLYVSNSGSDTNTGTTNYPIATIA